VRVNTQANAESSAAVIASAVSSGFMPEGQTLSAAQIKMVNDWAGCVP